MRVARRVLLGLGIAILALAFVAAGTTMVVAQNGGGIGGWLGEWAAGQITKLLTTPGEGGISVGRVGGSLPGRIELHDIAVSDAQGVWTTVDSVTVVWHPLKLITGTADVDLAEIAGVRVARLPAGSEKPGTQPSEPFKWPTLPVNLRIDRFVAEDVRLAEPVIGTAASLRAEGRLAAEESGAARSDLVVERTDGTPGRIEAKAEYVPADSFLRLDATVDEPADGLIAHALQAPGLPPVSLHLAGEGPLSGWKGKLTAALGDATGLTADLALARMDGDVAVDAAGKARVAALLDPSLRPLLGDGVDFAVKARNRGTQILEVESARATTSAAEVTAAATLDLGQSRIEGQAAVALRNPAAVQPLVAPAELADVALSARFAGPLTAPEVKADARAARLAVPEAELRDVTAAVAVTPAAPADPAGFRGTVTADVRAGSVRVQAQPGTEALLAGPLTLGLEGAVDMAAGQVRIARLAIDNPQLNASATGEVDLNRRSGELDARLEAASLTPLSPLLGLPVSGAAELTATLRAEADLRDVRAEIAGALTDLASPQAPLQAIFGSRTTLKADLVTPNDGTHRFDIKVDAAAADLAAKGSLTPDFGRIDAEYRVAVADLKPFSAVAGNDLAGRATLSGTVEGPTADPTVTAALKGGDIVVAQQPLGSVDGGLRVETPASGARGHVEVSAHPRGERASVATDFAVAGETLRISDLRIATPGEAMTGQFAIPLGGGPIEGTLSGRIGDLGGLLAFAGAEGGGSGSVRLRLYGERGVQAAEASVDLRDVRVVSGGQAEPLRIARVSADGQATAADPARGRLRVAVTGLRSGPTVIDTLALTGSGSERKFDYALQARGTMEGPLQLDAAGTGALQENGTAAVTLARLDATVKGQRIALRRPARIVRGPDRLAVEGLELNLASGVLRADAALAASGVSGVIDLSALPLSTLQSFAPGVQAAGTMSARVRFSGPLPNPTGSATVTFDRVRFAAARELRPLEGRVEVDWRGGQLAVQATVGGFAPQAMRADLRLPFHLSEDYAPVIPPNGAISGSLAWQGQVEPLFLLLPLDEHRLRGIATIALGVGGTVAQPQATGYVELAQGAYENLMTGTIVNRIALHGEAQGDRIAITRFSGRDGSNGSLQATGYAAFSGAPVEVNLVLDHFTVTRRDDVTAETNADLRFVQGPEGGRLSGTITTTAVEIRLVNRLPPQVVDLQPIEKGRAVKVTEKAGVQVPTAKTPGIDLAVNVSLPRRVFVRGRGLDSEWAGNFAIRGTADDPEINGALRVVRGELQLLNNTLTLQPSSEIRVAKTGRSGFEAVLDIRATDQIDDLTVVVAVTGTASAPKLTFTSEPELPQDEVLARVLFGKNTGQLTPLEAVQLAAAVAELTGVTGGTGGFLDTARRSLGLDVLRLGGGENGGSAGNRRQEEAAGQPSATVTAGKYITKDVFVGVEQGTAAGSTAATVEIEVFPHVSVHSRISQEGSSNVGVKAEWDY